MRVDRVSGEDVRVDSLESTARERPDQDVTPGLVDLADEEHVQRHRERTGNLVRDG